MGPLEVKVLPSWVAQNVSAVVERPRPPDQHTTCAGPLFEPAGALVVCHAVVEKTIDDVVEVVDCVLAGVEGHVALGLYFTDALGDECYRDLYLSWGCRPSSIPLRLIPRLLDIKLFNVTSPTQLLCRAYLED
ncbi:hypothetical protein RRF57_009370 [Xylaria bambusicola]|uniref:Uncharacterized protein n=1 Tax=Xylaria bambusicola TaxID=326684 RepID=A0AAN7UWQ2_9PEZI